MKTISFGILLILLVAGAHCFEEMSNQISKESSFTFEGENSEYDYNKDQPKNNDEVEMDDERDQNFDEEIFQNCAAPRPPTLEQVAMMEKQKDGIYKDASAGNIDLNRVSLSQKVAINMADKLTWIPNIKCCPQSWKYGCRSSSTQRMPCFRNYHNGVRETCCPFYPTIYMARCLCDKCHIQTSRCIHAGRCAKRYTRRSLVAFCYSSKWSWSLRFFQKWVPSSCYCRIGRPSHYPYEVASDKTCQ